MSACPPALQKALRAGLSESRVSTHDSNSLSAALRGGEVVRGNHLTLPLRSNVARGNPRAGVRWSSFEKLCAGRWILTHLTLTLSPHEDVGGEGT